MDRSSEPMAIRVRDLVVGFGNHIVLDHLSLNVRRGEILGLVGASGGGKPVLLRTTTDEQLTWSILDRLNEIA